MPVLLEPITYILRANPTPFTPPEKYSTSATVTIDEDNIATVRGLAGKMTRALHREIVDAIKARGHARVKWRRGKGDKWLVRVV